MGNIPIKTKDLLSKIMIPSIILSAGYGKRLKPLTNNVPKCLVKINNIPILDFWINKLIKSNYGPF